MTKLARLVFAAASLMVLAVPAFAQDSNDDLLRPMIVRPTDSAAGAPPPPASSSTADESSIISPAPEPAPMRVSSSSRTAAPSPTAKLHLPPPTPKTSSTVNMATTPMRNIATA
ncbi:MAG TPA: hypothetical protein VHB73_01780, partial [Alphaproteobacteria bacterium]|nr:hypothetical protein [Alphaproteobacteria bacterium]